MRRKVGLAAGAVGLAFLLSSCWLLQSFVIGDYTLTPGQSTKVSFTLRPMDPSLAVSARQFVIVGVSVIGLSGSDTDLGVSKAVWGANGKFGGPLQMASVDGIVPAIAPGDCAQAGLDFTDIAGVTWKAFVTPGNKSDKGKVEKSSVVDVTIKAKAAEVVAGRSYAIMGVAGMWNDDGDGIPEASAGSDDSYLCWGIGSGGVTIVS
jgi:hypothetical protein